VKISSLFDFFNVPVDRLHIVMEENMIRIKCLGNEKECADVVFG
jgi:hypothetical protein